MKTIDAGVPVKQTRILPMAKPDRRRPTTVQGGLIYLINNKKVELQ